jgi:thymidylate synthase ThyX
MGQPAANQLQGTDCDNLGELSSRICYDSLGKGRSSEALHTHIKDVRNHSIYEHINQTIIFNIDPRQLIFPLLNRKGVWLEQAASGGLEVTCNMRALLEWGRHTKGINRTCGTEAIGAALRYHAHKLCPLIVDEPEAKDETLNELIEQSIPKSLTDLSIDQAWISLYLYGSRGFTHEQVRHRFAMSQRSTRYVDESQSEYIIHPLITQYLNDPAIPAEDRQPLREAMKNSTETDRHTYRLLVENLETYLRAKGMEGTQAKKQARGASRGFLANALASEMIFSAPISGWHWILNQRKNELADAEIREVYTPALDALKQSAYGHYFSEYITVPSPDGLGTVLAKI